MRWACNNIADRILGAIERPTMRAWDYPFPVVIIRCDPCGRTGRYSKARFIELVGGDTQLPAALGIIAKSCPKANKPADVLHDRCRAHYPELGERRKPKPNQ